MFTCDDKETTKLGSFATTKLLIQNDRQHGEEQQQLHQVHNSLIAPSPESLLVSKEENGVDGTLQMVIYSL